LAHYIEMFHRQTPIESQFQSRILNNLNAEIASGAISNISEAIEWIHFTYFYIRLRKNPLQVFLKYFLGLLNLFLSMELIGKN